MKNTVTIDGVSSDAVGLYFDKLPYIPSAQRRANTYQIPGAGEDLTVYSDDYDDIPMVLTAYIRPGTDPQAVYDWIHSGAKIVLSTQPTVYGVIKTVGEVAPSREGWAAHRFDIPFTLSPFRYLVNDEEIILSSNPAYISNAGNVHSLPLYTLTGCSGDVSLTVNGITFEIEDAPSDIYIDLASETVYNGNHESILESTTGSFWNMSLNPGTNEIAWSGTAESVHVKVRTRWV